MWSDILPAFVISLALSIGLTRAMLTLAPRVGLIDQPGERRIHSTPIPRAGGIAVWLSFMITLFAGLATGWLKIGGQVAWDWLFFFFFFLFSCLVQVYPMELMGEFDQLVLVLHPHHVGDHTDS